MTRCRFNALVLIAVVLFVAPNAALSADGERGMADDYDRLLDASRVDFDTPDAERIRRIRDAYESAFSELYKKLSVAEGAIADSDLKVLFDATYQVIFYTGRSIYLDKLIAISEELEARGIQSDYHVNHLHRSAIVSNELEIAAALQRQHPDLDLEVVPPTIPSEGSRQVWRLEENRDGGHYLASAETPISEDLTLVMLASPQCGFSRRAAESLTENGALLERIDAGLLVLKPPHIRLGLEGVRYWNDAYPQLELSLAHSKDDWPLFDYWSIPTFYLLNGERVVETIRGWPSDKRLTELEAALEYHGFIGQ